MLEIGVHRVPAEVRLKPTLDMRDKSERAQCGRVEHLGSRKSDEANVMIGRKSGVSGL